MTQLEARARFIYEAGRLHSIATGSHVVPEPYDERDERFRAQFLADVARRTGDDPVIETAEEAHESWMRAYKAMGWRWGPMRDVDARTHPDMLPFADLPIREQQKDNVYLAMCEIARQWIGTAEEDQ